MIDDIFDQKYFYHRNGTAETGCCDNTSKKRRPDLHSKDHYFDMLIKHCTRKNDPGHDGCGEPALETEKKKKPDGEHSLE